MIEKLKAINFIELSDVEKESVADDIIKLPIEEQIESLYYLMDTYKRDVLDYLKNPKFTPAIVIMKEKTNPQPPKVEVSGTTETTEIKTESGESYEIPTDNKNEEEK